MPKKKKEGEVVEPSEVGENPFELTEEEMKKDECSAYHKNP
jgi:hypothetical protein